MASSITPTSVQLLPAVSHHHSGVPLRLEKYLVKFTKAAQNDWVVFSTYVPGTFLAILSGYTIDGSSNGVEETNTFTSSGSKMTATSATTGTTYLTVLVSR